MTQSHEETAQTLRIWTLMLSNTEGVVVTASDSPPPDVFVIPDEDDNDPLVLVDDDDEDARFLMGVLNIDASD